MLPDLLLLDDPELGLHSVAVALIGDMIKSLAEERQIISNPDCPFRAPAPKEFLRENRVSSATQ